MNFALQIVCFGLLAVAALATSVLGVEFPQAYNSETETSSDPPTPLQSLDQLKLPSGFTATVFAAEPDVQNPIGMAWDARGRLWIAENYTYAENPKRFDLQLRDRIIIFEDSDGDGRSDRRKVFSDDVQHLTSVEVGHGGVWALCPPQLLFFPDKDRDDVPDGPAEVVLDGFTVPTANYHNFANGLRWGPDGWLYGRCGASAPGEVGKPGAASSERLPLRGGIWRYHPQRKVAEILTAGPMNAWGHDWNEYGELFSCNTVTGHLWHIIPGAHFPVPHTIDSNRRVYQLLDMHADHWHFDTGQGWTSSREGKAESYGGGHAHAGVMIYLADNWPEAYRRKLYTLNLFGRRANQEILEREGSGYVAKHGEDCLLFGDGWFRGIDIGYGPDGGVFVLDWSDTGECHENTGVHRTSGRIYKVVYGKANRPEIDDLAALDTTRLVKLHLHPNEWFVRQARLQLAERAKNGHRDEASRLLRELFEQQKDPVMQLRAMFSLHAIGATDDKFLRAQLVHPNEHVRVWAIRMLSDAWPIENIVSIRPPHAPQQIDQALVAQFVELGKSDPSNLVHLALATLLQRLPVLQREKLATALLQRGSNAEDHNLPLMIWYGLIAISEENPESLVRLATDAQLPLTRRLIVRRLGEDIEANPKPLNDLLVIAASKSPAFQKDVASGLTEALRGWSKAKKPVAWDPLQQQLSQSTSESTRNRARELNVLFGDGRALKEVRRTALDQSVDLAQRRTALETLIVNKPADLREICEQLLTQRFLNSVAVRGLAQFDDPAIGEQLVKHYEKFHPLERPAVIETLTSRPTFTKALLDEIAAGRMARTDITPFQARRIRSFQDEPLNEQLTAVWGELRDTPAEKTQAITNWKSFLSSDALAAADLSHGRAVFNKTCATCHRLYGHGDRTGLDLTGASRNNLAYLLDNIVDPSAIVNADYRMRIVLLNDGRTLNGVIISQSDRTITLKSQTETVVLDRNEIDHVQESSVSLMPEGLLESLSKKEACDLIAYLMHLSQVPLKIEP